MSEALVALPRGPFKGLMPFEDTERDALLFFGRERERHLISANLLAARLTVLYGESGVGKTSLLAAGVAHHLREQARENLRARGHPEAVVGMFSSWSDDPVAGLLAAAQDALAEHFGAAAVPDHDAASVADTLQGWTDDLGCDLLLILDQAEEYFLYHEGEKGPQSFVEQLPDLVTRPGLRVSVLLAIREDALAKLDRFKGRIPNLFGNYLRLEHLEREAARAAILGPIEQYNRLADSRDRVDAEPALVDAVLDQTAAGRVDLGQAGRGVVRPAQSVERIEAPYLQLVLERLWEEEFRVGSRTLRLETLRRLGGAAEIVRNHLERALEELSPDQKDIAASLFHYLVTPSGTKIAHAVGDLADYAAVRQAELSPVLSTLVRERILRPAAARNGASGADGSPVEIYHDVLAEAVLAWRGRHEAERALDEQRREADRRHRRTLLLAAASTAALAVVAAVAVFALLQRSEAQRQAGEARAQRAEADRAATRAETAARRSRARELVARAASLLRDDPEESLRLATRAAAVEPTPQVEDALRSALVATRTRFVLDAGGTVHAAAYSPDGRLIAVGGESGEVGLFRASTGRMVRSLRVGSPVLRAAFNPDGGLLATGDVTGAVILWRVPMGTRIRVIRHEGRIETLAFSPTGDVLVSGDRRGILRVSDGRTGAALTDARHAGPVRDISFGPSGRLFVAVGDDRFARLYDARSGALLRTFDQGGRLKSAQLGPTGLLLATAGANRKARLWDLGTGALLREFGGHLGHVVDVAFDPRGHLLATASTDGTARVWELHRYGLVATLAEHRNQLTGVAFAPNGFSLVTTSTDRTARVWQPGRGTLRAELVGHADSVATAVFSPNGRWVLTTSEDGTARVWDPALQSPLRPLRRLAGPLRGVAVSRDGARILVAGPGTAATLLDARRGRTLRSFRGAGPVRDAVLSPDGSLVAIASGRSASIWSADSDRLVRSLGHRAQVTAVAFGGDDRVATGTVDGRIHLWSGEGERTLRGHRGSITRLAFAPGGQRLVSASVDGTARVWSLVDGRGAIGVLRHADAVTAARFSPDGRRIVTASRDHDAGVWDASTLERGLVRRLRVLRGHFAVVSDVAVSPDGRWIVTAGPTTAGLWGFQRGRPGFLRGHRGRVTGAAFSPDGRTIVTSGRDGTVRRYLCRLCGGVEELLDLARVRRVRLQGAARMEVARR